MQAAHDNGSVVWILRQNFAFFCSSMYADTQSIRDAFLFERREKEEGTMDTQSMQQSKIDFSSFPAKAIAVITDPVGFYRNMPRTGGLLEPLVFAIVLSLTGIIIQIILGGLFGLGTFTFGSLWFLILWPILVTLFSFVGAGILYGIWALMGSQHSFETAYRSMAYMTAIFPVTAVLSVIPYLGTIVSTAWAAYILIVASIEVHGIKPNTAYLVFGGIGLLLILSNVSTEYGARRVSGQLEGAGKSREGIEDMTPEEAGKAVGEFLKGFEKGAGEKEATQ